MLLGEARHALLTTVADESTDARDVTCCTGRNLVALGLLRRLEADLATDINGAGVKLRVGRLFGEECDVDFVLNYRERTPTEGVITAHGWAASKR